MCEIHFSGDPSNVCVFNLDNLIPATIAVGKWEDMLSEWVEWVGMCGKL